MDLKKKFEEVSARWSEVNKELWEVSKEVIETKVKENGGRIEFDYDELEELGLVSVSVTYDGGNHPEYASDAFSTLYGAKIGDDGELYLIIEDDYDYEVDRVISSGELSDCAEFLLLYLETKAEYED